MTLVREDAVEGVDYTQAAFHISEVTREEDNALVQVVPVSYTHLTLPTILLV